MRGPLEGLKLAADHPTGDPSIAKLLGVYEHELWDIAVGGDVWDRVVNIGSGGGLPCRGLRATRRQKYRDGLRYRSQGPFGDVTNRDRQWCRGLGHGSW
ncbi:MAG: hypothetical protein OSB69_00175 [Alphaproteobacteria bacterium]|nr:hypothetical protein [Alphaproteobacteria bacterium]